MGDIGMEGVQVIGRCTRQSGWESRGRCKGCKSGQIIDEVREHW